MHAFDTATNKLAWNHDPPSMASPLWLKGGRFDQFQAEFSVQRVVENAGRANFILAGKDADNLIFIRFFHQNYWTTNGQKAPQVGYVADGKLAVYVGSGIQANTPTLDADDVLWVPGDDGCHQSACPLRQADRWCRLGGVAEQ